jgi:hypothetical protein
MVRCCAALLEHAHDRRCLTFGTATLPKLPADQLEKIQQAWATVVNRFFEELARAYARAGLKLTVIYVTEIQPGRWERSGEVALHLHWVCVGRRDRKSNWAVTPKQVAAIWAMVLGRVIGYEPDTTAATRLEVPRKSVSRELGKYLSKGSKAVTSVVDSGLGDRLPSAWWGGTRTLKRQVEESVIWLDRDQCLQLLDRQEEIRKSRKGWCLHHFIDRHDAESLPESQKRFWVGATFGFNCDRRVLLGFLKVLGYQDYCP